MVPREGLEPPTLSLEVSCSSSELPGRSLNGAGGENRTLVTCLEGRYINHYTTPAGL